MDIINDHTLELEQRLRAIKINKRDGCAFWNARSDNLVNIRQCWYCAYSHFDREKQDINQPGLCKFKK